MTQDVRTIIQHHYGLVHEADLHLEQQRSFGHECWRARFKEYDLLVKVSKRNLAPAKVQSEIDAHTMALSHDIPTPPLLHHDISCHLIQAPYMIQQWVKGQEMEAAIGHMSVDAQTTFAEQLGHLVAKIHTIKAPHFAESATPHVAPQPSWPQICHDRLRRLVDQNLELEIIPRQMTAKIHRILFQGLTTLQKITIEPRLTHRDLYLPNLVLGEGGKLHVLDWEGARFYDPLWDFVKLRAWIFADRPKIEAPLMRSYEEARGWSDTWSERVNLYEGMEYLSCIPYFGSTYPTPGMLKKFTARLGTWLGKQT